MAVEEGIIKARNEIRLVENLKIKKPPAGKRLVVPLFSEFDEIMEHLPIYMVTFCQGLKLTGYSGGNWNGLRFQI